MGLSTRHTWRLLAADKKEGAGFIIVDLMPPEVVTVHVYETRSDGLPLQVNRLSRIVTRDVPFEDRNLAITERRIARAQKA